MNDDSPECFLTPHLSKEKATITLVCTIANPDNVPENIDPSVDVGQHYLASHVLGDLFLPYNGVHTSILRRPGIGIGFGHMVPGTGST